MSFEYVPFEDADLQGALLVTGMPAVGMEGSVAASFLAQRLRMRILGAFQSDDLPPIGAVRDGIATSPIQVWRADDACGLDGGSACLLVLKSDLPLPPSIVGPLAASVTKWASERGVGLVIGLDSYALRQGETPRGVLVAASRHARDLRERVDGKPLDDALITGFTAALLTTANRHRLPALGLFAPSTRPEAEVAGTTALLEVARPLMPELDLDHDELAKLVEEKSHAMRQEREKQQEEARRMQELANRGYL